MSEDANVKLLDEIMVLFKLYDLDYNVIERSLDAIARHKEENPEHPITLSLYNYMRERGYFEPGRM